MRFVLCILLIHFAVGHAAILQCDFENNCDDFILDRNWGLTDGNHPQTITYDHTLNTSDGHYIFYTPKSDPPFHNVYSEIKTRTWLELAADRAVCFYLWFFTPRLNLPFSIQVVQGDDEQLTRILTVIPGRDPQSATWTRVNVTLPAEKIKLFIRLNSSIGPLDFDDLSIDYCDEPPPAPLKTLYECDFESSCQDDFVTLPDYSYRWSIMSATNAMKVEPKAPSVDYTFKNQSGHYAIVPGTNSQDAGKVGYLLLERTFNVTSAESFCLNFQYYGYARSYKSHLNVYTQSLSTWKPLQMLWPPRYQYSYMNDQWTWAIINLPVGEYELLFRVDTDEFRSGSFAIDNISITSCDYPPTVPTFPVALLSLSCDFDDITMCLMMNGNGLSPVTYNFTAVTGEMLVNSSLGPFRDHTTNSTKGGFIYWNYQLPYVIGSNGLVQHSLPVEANAAMCVRFAYYVKSSLNNRNATSIYLTVSGCIGAYLWSKSLDDSQGWQVVTFPVPQRACRQTFALSVSQSEPVPLSVAFDDIQVEQCDKLPPATTTTTTTTTTTSTTTTSTTTTTTTVTTSVTSITVPTTTPTHPTTVTTTTTAIVTSMSTSSTKFSSTPHGSGTSSTMISGTLVLLLLCFLSWMV